MYKKILHITMVLNGYPRPQGGLAIHICHENDDEDCTRAVEMVEREMEFYWTQANFSDRRVT